MAIVVVPYRLGLPHEMALATQGAWPMPVILAPGNQKSNTTLSPSVQPS